MSLIHVKLLHHFGHLGRCVTTRATRSLILFIAVNFKALIHVISALLTDLKTLHHVWSHNLGLKNPLFLLHDALRHFRSILDCDIFSDSFCLNRRLISECP